MKLDHKKLLTLISESLATLNKSGTWCREESYCIGRIGKLQVEVSVGHAEDIITASECICLTETNPHAVALGKRTSAKKAKAVRKNGKLGGRPKIKK